MLPPIKKLGYIFNLMLCFYLVSGSYAANKDYQNEGANFAKKQVGKIKKLKLEEILDHKEKLKAPRKSANLESSQEESCKSCVTNLEDPEELEKKLKEELNPQHEGQTRSILTEKGDKILVFVSFSMPNNSIRELSLDTQKYGARLYLRGIFEKSFKKTAQKILEVNNKGLALEINPNQFKKYKIDKVPTFVLVKDGEEISRLSGNVSLEYATSKLQESPVPQESPVLQESPVPQGDHVPQNSFMPEEE